MIRMASSRIPTRLCWLTVCLSAAASLEAAPPTKLSGSIIGHVRTVAGKAQMGASVALYNRYDKLVRQVLTNDHGMFLLDSLAPDVYSVRVSLSSFVPALRRGIAVQPGIDSVLNINLTSVFSSIEVIYQSPGQALMTDEWKWALRATQRTRPVLRYSPEVQVSSSRTPSSVFSGTRGMFNVSAGDSGGDPSLMGVSGTQADLGTAFALATSIYGKNQVQFSGNFGFVPQTGMPATGFRTTYSRNSQDFISPDVTLTYRQVFFQAGQGGGSHNVPALRTMSLSSIDKVQLAENVDLEYGFSLESVIFTNRLNMLSPFARLTYEAGDLGVFRMGYSSGAPPVDLYAGHGVNDTEGELRRDLAALSILPRMTLVDGRARTQRVQNMEIGYEKKIGSRTVQAAVYREAVNNAAVTVDADSFLYEEDLLPDLGSRAATFNAGRIDRWGFMTAVSQRFLDNFEASLSFGRGGALTASRRTLDSDSAAELRAVLNNVERMWASARVSGVMPVVGTRYATSYGWTDYSALMPGHLFLTQRALPETGWNIYLRQPVPTFSGMPGRLEISGELRNLLAQGYVPVKSGSGRNLQLIQSPRAVRGGLSFIF